MSCVRYLSIDFQLPAGKSKLDVTTIVKSEIENCVVQTVARVQRCILSNADADKLMLRTQGIALQELFRHPDLLDVNRICSNDIHVIAATYGIEAAARVLIKVSSR